MDIVNLLTEHLGVSLDQSRKGVGLLFNPAKDHLAISDFSQLSGKVPGIDNQVSPPPVSWLLAATVNGLATTLGGGIGGSGKLAGLSAGFSSSGLVSGMIGKLIPVILFLVEAKGGDDAKRKIADTLV